MIILQEKFGDRYRTLERSSEIPALVAEIASWPGRLALEKVDTPGAQNCIYASRSKELT